MKKVQILRNDSPYDLQESVNRFLIALQEDGNSIIVIQYQISISSCVCDDMHRVAEYEKYSVMIIYE